MKSNLGWSFPPIFIECEEEDLLKKNIRLIHPFKMQYNRSTLDRASVFMRGRELIVKYYENLPKLIKAINSGELYNIQYLLNLYPSNLTSNNLSLKFIQQSIEHKAVELIT